MHTCKCCQDSFKPAQGRGTHAFCPNCRKDLKACKTTKCSHRADMERTCTKCHVIRTCAEYKDIGRSKCRACENEVRRKGLEENKRAVFAAFGVSTGTKKIRCPSCEELKGIARFSHALTKDGSKACRACFTSGEKRGCKVCMKTKQCKEFYGDQHMCKLCRKTKNKQARTDKTRKRFQEGESIETSSVKLLTPEQQAERTQKRKKQKCINE